MTSLLCLLSRILTLMRSKRLPFLDNLIMLYQFSMGTECFKWEKERKEFVRLNNIASAGRSVDKQPKKKEKKKKPKQKSCGKETKATHVAASKIVALSAPHLPKQQKLHQFQRPRCAGQRLKSQTGGDSPGDRHQEDLINGNGQRDKVHSTFNLQFVIVSRGGEREHKTANRKRHPAPAGTRQSVCQQNVIIFFGNTIIIRSKKKIFKSCSRTVALLDWHFSSGSRCTLRIRNARFIYAPCACYKCRIFVESSEWGSLNGALLAYVWAVINLSIVLWNTNFSLSVSVLFLFYCLFSLATNKKRSMNAAHLIINEL